MLEMVQFICCKARLHYVSSQGLSTMSFKSCLADQQGITQHFQVISFSIPTRIFYSSFPPSVPGTASRLPTQSEPC